MKRWSPLSWLFLPLLLIAVSCVSARKEPPAPVLTRFESERPEMGIPFRLVFYAPDQATAEKAADAAFSRVEQLNHVMSDYDAESELSKLSATSGQGREVRVSDDLWFVLSRAQDLAKRSGGAFDVTVGPCVNLWREARRRQKLPAQARLAQARQAVGYQHMRLNPKRQTVELLVPNMQLDLGGIGKGYAADEALKTLKSMGINRALIEAGGDMVAGDPPPSKPAWRIQLSPLDITNAPPAQLLRLKNQAISTSGDLYQRLEIDGKRYSHIVDPRTGIGLTDHSLVNVVAPNGITSDSLTKVVAVLGREKGLPIVEATPGAAVRVMRKPGDTLEVYESKRFRRCLEAEAPKKENDHG